ncbi:MAG: tyrosine-type recombinase/integrase [Lachnospiraceae bacterium]|nr:tyrosine-type recombinase/integrase [Lachnospiraceae bacterium]MDY5741776.1 tyrosine-type recombinase/integrase [Lachnospiraceae bacterium]
MADHETFHQQVDIQNTLKLREILTTLPKFLRDYFRALEPTTSTRTRISYAYDLRIFFHFILKENPAFEQYRIQDLPLGCLDQLEAVDIEEYQEYLKVYFNQNDEVTTNGERGLKRKMSALRSMYQYFYKRELIQKNTPLLVNMPKLHERTITRLDSDEVNHLLDVLENGCDGLTKKQRSSFQKTRERDFALISLLLGTGIRVSECVGLDLEDVDFKHYAIRIIRKGGNESRVYFNEEVAAALTAYLDIREGQIPLSGHEHALFLSTQHKRIGIRAVQNLVKKYAAQVTTTKRITPHKLRSTYGTSLYEATGDIYLVADVLGHKDVNTTKKHYAAMDEERRRRAADFVNLRQRPARDE